MGCGASAGKKPLPFQYPEQWQEEGGDIYAVIVWGASGLRKGDYIGSDPYCVVRVGPAASPWSEKLRGSGRRSSKVDNKGDHASPQWGLGFVTDVAGMERPEVHVRVYDADLFSDDDFLGEARVALSELLEAGKDTSLALSGEGAQGSISVRAGRGPLLQELGVKPSAIFEQIGPMGALKSVAVQDITGAGPLRVGVAPLPPTLRGIFWLTEQGSSSALVSMAGPTRDGGGCNPGRMIQNRMSVRVGGDRVWAFADKKISLNFIRAVDLIYNFVFDSSDEPTRCQIYPEARNLSVTLTAEQILDFEMHLADGDERYPGSVVWRRPSFIAGQLANEYALVQVIDEHGSRIQPAWDKFVEYQTSSAAGSTPGEVFYHDLS